jgi:CheY-like chemotaxis protein
MPIKEKTLILVAEDDADDRLLLQTAFAEKGFKEKLEFVDNGVELFKYLDNVAGGKETTKEYPHFILLDLNMPKKDGREVLTEIKQHPLFKKIPVVVFTTTKNENEIKRCYELGANTYVIKPATYDALKAVLTEIREYWFNTASISVYH